MPTEARRQQLRDDHEVAAALCLMLGLQNCKELREMGSYVIHRKDLSTADLATLATLGMVLRLILFQPTYLHLTSKGAPLTSPTYL